MYQVVGRYTRGTINTGFLIEESDSGEEKKRVKCSTAKFMELARNEQIKDFKVTDIDGEELLVGLKNDISVYPALLVKGNLTVVNRLLDDGHVVGYKVKNIETGEESSISKTKAWELAFYGTLSGIKALYKKENGNLRKILITS